MADNHGGNAGENVKAGKLGIARPAAALGTGDAEALVAVPGRKPVTRGLALARDRVLDAARDGHNSRFDVIADGGCGKTRLLEELAEGLRELGYATLFITVSPRRADGDEPGDDADRMSADEVAYHQLIADLASDVSKAYERTEGTGSVLDPETGRRIEKRLLAAISAVPQQPGATPGTGSGRPIAGPAADQRVSAGRDAYVAGRDVIFYHMSDVDQLRARWSASLTVFAAAMREFAGHCPVAILVDDLHLVLGTGTGRWLTGVLDQLPGIMVVHARRPDAARGALGRAEVIRLMPMSQRETEAFALRELPGWAPAEAAGLGALVFQVTGGYPVWVGACCQLIAAEAAQGVPASRVRQRLLDGMEPLHQAGLMDRFGRFVDDYCAGLLGTAAPVFDVLAILRRVSRDRLASLLAGHGLDGSACGTLFDWLKESDFMTPFDDSGPDIRLHDVIRHRAERRLRQHQPSRYRELHASAERYYRTTLNLDQEPEEGISRYQYGARYEDLDWQVNSLEWLHHAGQVDDQSFPPVMRAMIRLFLDAFYWYESDFMLPGERHYSQELLAQYRALPGRPPGQQWLRYLEAFRENYIADPDCKPGQHPEHWMRAQDAIRGLWHCLQLNRAKIPDDPDLRRIQILLSTLRADAEYFGGKDDEPSRQRAAAWYTEAEQAASLDEGDQWIANWALYLKAGMYTGTDPSTARELIRPLRERIAEQEDHELPFLLMWMYGDLAWAAGDKARAFDIYARAVLHAYVFHIRQEFTPQNPSSLTVAWYQTITGWTRRRLDEAREEGPGHLADGATSRMNALFAPYWNRTGRSPDNAEGFPSQPAREDLGTVDSPFAETILWMLDAMHARLEEPIDGPLLLN
jgi:hypothetical protein